MAVYNNSSNGIELNKFSIIPSFNQSSQNIACSIAPTFIQTTGSSAYYGLSNTPAFSFSFAATGTIPNCYGLYVNPTYTPGATSGTLSLTNCYGLYVTSNATPLASGSITNQYGIACDTPTGTATHTYTAYFGSSNTAKVGLGTSTPNQTLSIVGSISCMPTAVSGTAYTALSTDSVIDISSTGAFTLTLPAPSSSNVGQIYVVKDVSGNAFTNNITIQSASGNIDGNSSIVIAVNYGYIKLYNDGTHYFSAGEALVPITSSVAWIPALSSTTMTSTTGYYVTGAGSITLTLPATSVTGSLIQVTSTSLNTSGFVIAQGPLQSIQFGKISTTVGSGGSLASSAIGDSLSLLCTVANTTWQVVNSIGNLLVT